MPQSMEGVAGGNRYGADARHHSDPLKKWENVRWEVGEDEKEGAR